jgi:hypothetical protein
MQTLGTEWGRNLIGPQFWTGIAQHWAQRNLQDGHSVVIDDVRFPNEAEVIKRMGGILVRVIRPDNVIDESHPSESLIGTLKEDVIVVNDQDIAVLHARARLAVEATS